MTRIGAFSLFTAFRAWTERQRAADELSNLTDRELSDIGLCRSDIGRVAAGAFVRPEADVVRALAIAPAHFDESHDYHGRAAA